MNQICNMALVLTKLQWQWNVVHKQKQVMLIEHLNSFLELVLVCERFGGFRKFDNI